jgi:PAS domain S-box-containing protein
MKFGLKLLIIVASVFLIGYILEEAMDQSGLNNPGLVEHPLEILSELFSAFVAFSIFAITWHAYSKSKDNHSLLLGSSFAIVGLLILFHTLSYPFMPDFLTPNSSHKASIILMGSRLILAVSLVAGAYTYKDTFPKLINKRVLLSSVIALSVASLAILLYYHDSMFANLDTGKGYSSVMILFISINTAIILYAIYLYDKRIKETGQKNLIFLIYGSIIVVFSNIVHISYEYSGHFLIITGFFFIYLALYKSSVELPYEKLAQAEEKLRRASEDKYRNLFDNANDAIITTDPDDRITSWNRSAGKIFGWGAQEVIGRKLSHLIVPDELREKTEQFLGNALIGRGITEIETAGLHKNGGWIDVSLTISPMLNTEREIIGLSEIFRDIRERKKIEMEKDKLLKAIDHSIDGIIIGDEKDRYIYLNEAYEKIYGYTGEELIGETWRKLIDSELIAATELELDRTIHNKNVGILSGEFPGVSKDGLPILLDVRSTGLWDESGNYQGHICIVRDITERKRGEEKLLLFRNLIEQSNDAIFVNDHETGRILDVNDKGCSNLGYTREELLNMKVSDFEVNLNDDLSWKEHIKQLRTKGNLILEGQHRRKDGTTFPVEVNISFIVLGKNSYMVAVVRDITERKRIDEQIIQSLKEKEILLREIHHRVKNNMQIVSSLLGLQSGYIKEKKYIEMFRDSQNRINSMSLIHEKLYFSKDLAKIEFNEYISDLANSLFQSQGVKVGTIELSLNIENVSLGIDQGIPCGLIINELITNSLKYAFPDGRKGEIKVSLCLNDENMVELVVGDNGVGIPDDIDFRKTESLGLRLVTILAEDQLHGEINLDRSRGTEFKIKFKGVK